MRASKISEI